MSRYRNPLGASLRTRGWAHAVMGAPPAQVREALATAIAAERRR